jgi:hypothetical protein
MNQYGTQAQAHWREWLPTRYSQIADPTTFFSDLGQRVSDQVIELSAQIAGPDIPGEGYLGKVGRLNNARMQAEEVLLREEVLLTPEKTSTYDPELDRDLEEPSEREMYEARATAEMTRVWVPLTEAEEEDRLVRYFVP